MSPFSAGFWVGSAPPCESLLRNLRNHGRRLVAQDAEFLWERDQDAADVRAARLERRLAKARRRQGRG